MGAIYILSLVHQDKYSLTYLISVVNLTYLFGIKFLSILINKLEY